MDTGEITLNTTHKIGDAKENEDPDDESSENTVTASKAGDGALLLTGSKYVRASWLFEKAVPLEEYKSLLGKIEVIDGYYTYLDIKLLTTDKNEVSWKSGDALNNVWIQNLNKATFCSGDGQAIEKSDDGDFRVDLKNTKPAYDGKLELAGHYIVGVTLYAQLDRPSHPLKISALTLTKDSKPVTPEVEKVSYNYVNFSFSNPWYADGLVFDQDTYKNLEITAIKANISVSGKTTETKEKLNFFIQETTNWASNNKSVEVDKDGDYSAEVAFENAVKTYNKKGGINISLYLKSAYAEEKPNADDYKTDGKWDEEKGGEAAYKKKLTPWVAGIPQNTLSDEEASNVKFKIKFFYKASPANTEWKTLKLKDGATEWEGSFVNEKYEKQ